ncbi:MAG: hypothetical protein CL792_05030 [Chloroflexi bacterium]|nr:hypothetical protein [Chloroflexota bacterium]|tara:strand:- start:458 stop:1336 length:879 start_codon:yes stop_codon:yes gene_type:complete
MTLPHFRFVDAHVHFYDMQHPTLFYADWQPDSENSLVGTQMRQLGTRNYLASDFIAESSSYGVDKVVHVQAAIGSKDPVEETKWLQQVYDNIGIPNAIVGHVDLRSEDAHRTIERHTEYSNFKGIRDFSYGDYLINNDFRKGFSLLEKYDLIASIAVQWQDMEKLADLARTFPNISIILDHAGTPTERNEEYFMNWRTGMSKISGIDNIICKISGLGMGDNHWTIDSIRPYVETCIELFGINRSLFATNWPVDSLWSSYGDVINAYREITKNFAPIEIEQLFSKNTEEIYNI